MDDQAATACLATDCAAPIDGGDEGNRSQAEIPPIANDQDFAQSELVDEVSPIEEPHPPPEDLIRASQKVNGDERLTPVEGPHPAEPTEPAPEIFPAQIIEAVLFASDSALSAARLAELMGAGTPTQVRKHIEELNAKYANAGLAFRIESIARGYQMLTLPAFRPWLQKLDKHRSRTRLSDAALEALAIVAYKQPIIRANVEAIRGVACGEVLARLRDMGLIKIVGRAEIVGRPMLFGTTRKFLDIFGLVDLDDLPPMEALTLKRPSETAEPAKPVAEDDGGPSGDTVAAAGA